MVKIDPSFVFEQPSIVLFYPGFDRVDPWKVLNIILWPLQTDYWSYLSMIRDEYWVKAKFKTVQITASFGIMESTILM